jgi:RNA polymerase sigma-70 factor (sigma-E family)
MGTRAAAGPDRLRELFDAHYVPMLRLATLLLDDGESAKETVQDAYVRMHGRRLDFDDPARAASYLRSTVLNLARSQLRRRGVAHRHRQPAPDDARSAEEGAVLRLDQEQILRAVNNLPRRQRECLVLRYYLDLSENEIATTMGVSPGSVKKHASRGLAVLARTLEGLR